MKKRIAVLILVLAAGGAAVFVLRQGSRAPLPADMEVADDVRSAVDGKRPEDVSKITIELVWPSRSPTVVTAKRDVAGLLAGLQQAIRPKVRYGCAGPRLGVFWNDHGKPSYFHFCIDHGPKHAYGIEFARAYNRVAPDDWKVDLPRR